MTIDSLYSLTIQENYDSESCMDTDLTILYVIQGGLTVTMQSGQVFLHASDILAINPGTEYASRVYVENMVCCLKISGFYILQSLQGKDGKFVCSSAEKPEMPYGEMRRAFRKLIRLSTEKHRTNSAVTAVVLEIYSYLTEEFLEESGAEKRTGSENETAALGRLDDAERMRRIMLYIGAHLKSGCSITDLAQSLYISPAALSRFFLKQTGIHFSDYIKKKKMEKAAEELIGTDKSAAAVAAELGFSGASSFHHAFADYFGQTPTVYRTQHKAVRVLNSESVGLSPELKEKLSAAFGIGTEAGEVITEKYAGERIIDIRDRKGTLPNWCNIVTAGPAGDMALVNVQQHILRLKKETGVKYIRFWNPFSTKLMVTDGKTAGNFNFDLLDQVLDFLTDAGIIPFIDFGARNKMALRKENDQIFAENDLICFASKELWTESIKAFAEHIRKRYGNLTDEWIFEFSNFWPDRFLSSYREEISDDELSVKDISDIKMTEFCDAFIILYRIVKSEIPDAKVGGPGFMFERNNNDEKHMRETERMLSKCIAERCVPDFMSFIIHKYDQSLGRFGEDKDISILKEIRNMMDRNGAGNAKLIVTEWYSSVSSRNYLNDSCYRSAFFCRKMIESLGIIDSASVAVASDWTGNYFDSRSIAIGGNGLLTKTGMEKPIYVFLRTIRKIPETVIARDENYILTGNEQGKLFLLCCNFAIEKKADYEMNELISSPGEAVEFINSHRRLSMDIVLRGLQAGKKYTIHSYEIGSGEGALLSTWGQFGFESELEEAEEKYIRNSLRPVMRMEKRTAVDGTLRVSVRLGPFAVCLYQIEAL